MLEICVDAPDDLRLAVAGGAERIELCSALALGGLTPSPGLIALSRDCPVPVYAMIRARAGDFHFTPAEADQMEAEVMAIRAAGFAGVVLGASDGAGALDLPLLKRLILAAGDMGLTLHRVVDTFADPVAAIGPAIDLGFDRILTSGGADKAPQGLATLSRMVNASAGRIGILAGSGVAAIHVPDLARIGIREFHASCAATDAGTGNRRIDPAALANLRRAVDQVSMPG